MWQLAFNKAFLSKMAKHDALSTVNKLVKISICNSQHAEIKAPYKSFGLGKSNISFVGEENTTFFSKALNELYLSDKEIYNTVSEKNFENKLVQLIRDLKQQATSCQKDNLNTFFEYLKESPTEEHEILYELYGATLDEPIVNYGDFSIYNYELSKDIMVSKYPALTNDIFFENRKSNIFLGIKVFAKDNVKATELADEIAEAFENTINYMIGDLKHEHSVSIFNYMGWTSISRVICKTKSMGLNSNSNITYSVDLADPRLTSSENGNDIIWKLFSKSNKTEIEKRLLQSITWIGKGVLDKDKSKALVQFIFSIEGLLQYDDKSFTTPSIVSQMSDWLAFIIEDNVNERKEIVKNFKQTYKNRSAVVHGGARPITSEDVLSAFTISKLLVINLLTKKPFNKMSSMQQLGDYITELKFK